LYVDSGVAKIAFRHLPLERIHRFAKAAAEVAECAARQDRFTAMYDALFDRSDWTVSGQLLSLAGELGLKQDRLQDCVTSEADAKIESDGVVARKLGISVTPTFLIGSVAADGTVQVSTRLSGVTPLSEFQEAIKKARSK
jgi:protein-disulfide isomerase